MKVTAQVVNITCTNKIREAQSEAYPCGGTIYDSETLSFDITSDTRLMACDQCMRSYSAADLPKTARLFV